MTTLACRFGVDMCALLCWEQRAGREGYLSPVGPARGDEASVSLDPLHQAVVPSGAAGVQVGMERALRERERERDTEKTVRGASERKAQRPRRKGEKEGDTGTDRAWERQRGRVGWWAIMSCCCLSSVWSAGKYNNGCGLIRDTTQKEKNTAF